MVNPHNPRVKFGSLASPLAPVVNIWRFRRLAFELGRREFRSRFVGSMLGGAWALIEPAVQFFLYLTVFAYFLGMRLEEGGAVGAYGIFLLSGLVPFQAFQETLVRATSLVRTQGAVVRHVNVPIEVVLAGSLAAALARHGVTLLLTVAAAVAMGTVSLGGLPWLAAGVLLLLAFAFSAGLLLVPAGAFLPDLARVVETFSVVLFFASPVVYPLAILPEGAARWLPLNPLVGVLGTFRAALVGQAVDGRALAVSVAAAAVLAVIGTSVFAARHRAVRDLT